MSISSASALLAHVGHAGDHGWLAGGLAPLLSVDHFLAGLFVAAMVSVGVWLTARRGRAERARARR